MHLSPPVLVILNCNFHNKSRIIKKEKLCSVLDFILLDLSFKLHPADGGQCLLSYQAGHGNILTL